MTTKLISGNPELLYYAHQRMHITVLGGIKLTGLDRLRVTLKVVSQDNPTNAFRHNLNLYNSIQTTQVIERLADFLDIPTDEVRVVVNDLTSALEEYRAEHLESLKPKVIEAKVLTDKERKEAVGFLKSPDLISRTPEAIRQSGLVGEENSALIAYLVYTSRKRHTPLHLMCLGASGTGKTLLTREGRRGDPGRR